MTDWKDTVIPNLADAIIKHPNLPMGEAIAIEQAEIAFKAGLEEESTQAYHAGLVDGRIRGIKEVVEWVAEHITLHPVDNYIWQAKLKEWEIK